LTPLCQQTTSAIQGRLADLAYYRVKIDGLPGPATSDAIVRFKARNGLRARDFVGPITLGKLFSPDAVSEEIPKAQAGVPPWLAEARRLLGVREVPGPGNNPKIMWWAQNLDQWYTGDDVPWCGLFVAHCMAFGAPDEPQDFNRLGARAWAKYGAVVDTDTLRLGAIAVFWRTHPVNSWHGHVAFVTGVSPTAIRVIGGNQSNAVTETWIARKRLLTCVGPKNWNYWKPAPFTKTGVLSTNEA